MAAGRIILILGMPRSGTTWLAKIFDSHPDTIYRHEPDSGGRLDGVPLVLGKERAESYRAPIERFANNLIGLRDPRVCAKLPVFRKSYYPGLGFHVRRAAIVMERLVSRVGLTVPIPDFVGGEEAGNTSLVWKSVESMGRLGAIIGILGNVKVIYIMRHPCAYIASVLRGEKQKRFKDAQPSSEDYGILAALLETKPARRYGLTMELMRGLAPIERMTWRWLLFNELALDETAGDGRCIVVRYEDVCKKPQDVCRKLFEWAGLEWCTQTEEFIRASTSRASESFYGVYKDAQKSANRWRAELSGPDQERVLRIVDGSALRDYYRA